MDWNPDFRDLFFEFNTARAEFLVVGGYAVIYWAEPRFTKDLDIFIRADEANARRVREALTRFGAAAQDVSIADLVNPRTVLMMGLPPNRIDVLTSISGVDFADAWPQRAILRYDDQDVPVIDIDDLITAKRAAGRPQDLIDVDRLLAVKAKQAEE